MTSPGTERRCGSAPSSAVQPAIADYGFISDCHSVALVSRAGSIDWCCMPRIDAPSSFGRLLDREKGGWCSIEPVAPYRAQRRYLDGTLVLETCFSNPQGEARLVDAFAMRRGGREEPHSQLLRTIEGVRGAMQLRVVLAPRFDYGAIEPWLRSHGASVFTAIGANFGFLIGGDVPFRRSTAHDLEAIVTVAQGERLHLSLDFRRPHQLHPATPPPVPSSELGRRLDVTIDWWRRWSRQAERDLGDEVLRSAIVIKGLSNAPTGAIAAAATCGLPEVIGGTRNWDYRYTWIRDASFAVQALLALGFEREAVGFRHFIERATADEPEGIQILYGVGGERRLTEETRTGLSGYRGSLPIRVGNAAFRQQQLDVYGEQLDAAWRLADGHGRLPDADYWCLLRRVIDVVTQTWQQPDQGIWEMRGQPRHFVHSKVMCWAALDCGIRLIEKYAYDERPLERWRRCRDAVRQAIEEHGYDRKRGVYVQSFERADLDAALLLLPRVGFVAYDDERMLRTTAAIRAELEVEQGSGLLRRYRSADGLDGDEGCFLACSFWLAECLARQGRVRAAGEVFDAAARAGNDLGLFSEEYDPSRGVMLGNFPQALTHYSHINAALALDRCGQRVDRGATSTTAEVSS